MRRAFGVALTALCLSALVAAPSIAQTLNFTAGLDGAQEVPPVTTTATGTATFVVNDAQTEIAYSLSVTGIDSSTITAAHIHFGAPGVDGPILFPLASGPFTSPLAGTLTAADFTPQAGVGINTFADALAAMVAGNTYVNVHTTANVDGEIRGQIIAQVAGEEITVKMRSAINPRAHGVVAVGLLSNSTFNACTANGGTITLGVSAAAPRNGGKCTDVNDDGSNDLLMHFRVQDLGIQCGDTSITLSGQLTGGQAFQVTQPIRTVGCGHGHGHGHN